MKIVQVINAMINNSEKITNVIQSGQEYFFLYDNEYKWSIKKGEQENEFYLYLYPLKDMSIDQLSIFNEWQDYNFVTFKSHEIKTPEAIESFSELYQTVASKVYGLDDIFEKIINS